MLSGLKIRTKLLLGFGVVVALMLLNAIWLTVSSRQIEAAMRASDAAADTVITMKDAFLEVRQGRVMAWSYMATGEPSYLSGRDTAFRNFDDIYKKALALKPSAEAVRLMDDFRAAVVGFRDAAVKMNDLKKQGTAATAPEMVAVMKEVDAGARLYAETNGKAAGFLAKQNDLAAKQAYDQLSSSNTITLVLVVVLVAASAIIAFLLSRAIATPVRDISGVIGQLAQGSTDVDVPHRGRGDEVGDMAQSVEVLREALHEAHLTREAQAAREEGERRVLARRQALAEDFVSRMQQLASGFASSSQEVADSARNLSSTAEETSRQAQHVAHAAEEAATNVQTVAASSEELAASVSEITQQVSHSADVADVAFREAESSNARIVDLTNAAAAIGDVLNLIKGIADQTNLLALNATIEAARAGEAGKGFAVVASEVKELAGQTAKATTEISTKINEIQQATNGTVSSMSEIVRVVTDIKSISSSIASAVEQQGAATGEIAENCQRAASGTQQVTENIEGVGRSAQVTGAASQQLLSLSQNLSGQAADLRTVVERFVQDLNAA